MLQNLLRACVLALVPTVAMAQGVQPTKPVGSTLAPLFPNAFASADNVAAQTATAMHGLTFIWDGANWDRWTGAVTQSGTWNITNISGTVSLPTGAATLAEQQTQTTSLQLIDDLVHASDAAVNKAALIGCQFDDVSPGTTTENNVRPVRCSTLRELYGVIRDAAGNARGANVNASNQLSVSVDNTVTVNTHAVTGSGNFSVVGPAADGAAVSGNPVRLAGKDGSGNTQDIITDTNGELQVDVLTLPSVTVGTFPDNEPFNLNQIAGAGVSTGVGASGTGTQRTAALIHDGTDTAQVTATGGGSLQVECSAGCGGGTQYAEDSIHASGDSLTMAGVVQQTADAALAADGDRTALQVDANGYLKVNIKAGAGSGGTAAADNSAFTGGTTNVTPMGAIYDTTPPTITDGSVGAPRMDSNRYLYVDCVVGCSGGATIPSDNFANPTDAGNSAAFNFVWDGATWDRAPGNSTDGLLVNLGANNDVTVTSSALPTGAATETTLGTRLADSTFTGRFPAAAAVADDTANPTLTGIASYNMCYDGTTWDRCRGTTIDTDDGTIAGAQVTSLIVAENYVYDGTNWSRLSVLADDGAAAATNRVGVLPSIAQSGFNSSTAGRNTALNTVAGSGLLMSAALPEPSLESYSASGVVASAASATDIAILPGNANNTVLVTEVRISCTQTTAGNVEVHLVKRSTANSGGTSTGMTEVPDDANYSAADSAGLFYTANPTTGSTVGDIDIVKLGCMATGTTVPNDLYIGNFRQKPIVLRGTAQGLAVNLNGVTVSGGSFAITYKWIEASGL